jgi:uncharacterized membrane protein
MTPQGPTWEYLHLVAAPFTIVLTLSGALVGLAGWVAGREGGERWGILALLIAGVFAIPAYYTGLTAADVVATRTFVRPSLIQTHRTWATWSAIASVSTAVFAAFSLYQPDDRRLRRFVIGVALAVSVLVSWAAFLGGKIVHGPEADEERIEETALGTAADRDLASRTAPAAPASLAGPATATLPPEPAS